MFSDFLLTLPSQDDEKIEYIETCVKIATKLKQAATNAFREGNFEVAAKKYIKVSAPSFIGPSFDRLV